MTLRTPKTSLLLLFVVCGTLVRPASPASLPPWQDAASQTASKPAKVSGQDAEDKKAVVLKALLPHPVLWQEPGNIAGKEMLYGVGGREHQPKAPFTFDTEAKSGTNPKFDVRDADGKKWRVKLGEESKPEVTASRLLWAVGYFTNEDYLLPSATVEGIKLQRGGDHIDAQHAVQDARFQRRPGGEKKIGIWKWQSNPFVGTREWNGLRVMMAVINNWDLKDENNAVYEDEKGDRQILLASDLGASFGTNSLSYSRGHSKGNIESFRASRFIVSKTADEVNFGTPGPANGFLAKGAGFTMFQYLGRLKLDQLGQKVPIKDARWMGSLLGQLTHQQLEDAFRAGNFTPEEVSAYVTLVEERIAELKAL